jgi:(1->4)-alpha-D-glucan 1-alpha-D-glucosylmutase
LKPDSSFPNRFKAYAIKAAREGKVETSWLNPNVPYENGLTKFLDHILDDTNGNFRSSVSAFVLRLSLLGTLNSLAQLTLKATMPGVPDFYQGTEFWDLSLVDPDNRRPVDFAARNAVLDAVEQKDWPGLVENWMDSRFKLAWTKTLLDVRRASPDVFSKGAYEPLAVEGPERDHVIAYARRYKADAAIIAVGRHFTDITDRGRYWPHTAFDAMLDTSAYAINNYGSEVLSGKLPLRIVFRHLPAVILVARKLKS